MIVWQGHGDLLLAVIDGWRTQFVSSATTPQASRLSSQM
jgi:hypothetical protein